jgi:hypothetical protein
LTKGWWVYEKALKFGKIFGHHHNPDADCAKCMEAAKLLDWHRNDASHVRDAIDI